MPPKSILKKTQSGSQTDPRYTDRHREIALHHANLIQHQKDAESSITAAVEELIDFPIATTDPAAPSAGDILRLRELLRHFTATDYDDLLEERNLAERCGYALCPNPAPKRKPQSKFRLDFSGTGPLKKVPNMPQKLWCSRACAKRALYIKVQLSEFPVWERQGGHGDAIELLPEDDVLGITKKMEQMDLATSEEERLRQALDELALERGETSKSARPGLVMTKSVVEKPLAADSLPSEPSKSGPHDSIEGYIPKGEGAEDTDRDIL